jgi:predicted  nucleic acid-binding Zn-ribbon protein
MDAMQKYEKLKRKVGTLQSKADRAEGALEEQMKILAEFGCSTIKEAEEQISSLEITVEKARKKLDAMTEEFETEHQHVLEKI